MNSLVFASHVTRQYDSKFAQSGAKIGDTIDIRLPIRPVAKKGRVANVQDIVESRVSLTLDQQVNIALNYTSADMALSMDNFRERYIKPSVIPIANQIDLDGLLLTQKVYNLFGTPGSAANDKQLWLNAGARLLNEGCPDDERWCTLVTPGTEAQVVGSLAGLYNPQTEISRQYERGRMFRAVGFDWYHDQNMYTHTVGALGGTPLVDGANQTGSSLLLKGWTHSVATRLKKGDVFTVAGVYAVNPVSRVSTGELRQFVVTADAASDSGGGMTVAISPALTPVDSLGNAQQFQTVTASPADGAAITVVGTANTVSPMNLVFHPEAFALGMADLPMPKSGEAYRISDEELGVTMRVWESSDFVNDVHGVRIDVLYGWVCIYPQWAVRIAS
jgi:hypothetical protein